MKLPLHETILNLFFPLKCPLCGTLTDGGRARLCPDCAEKANDAWNTPCPVCHRTAVQCECLPDDFALGHASLMGRTHLCIGFYDPAKDESVASRLIFALKEQTCDAAAYVLAQHLARELMRLFCLANEDIRTWTLVYPPRTAERKAELGFDQAELLTRFLAGTTGARRQNIFRRKGGREQKRLNGRERAANAARSLTLPHPEQCRGQKFILIDDILTSGATLSHCARLLYDAGAEAVFSATVLKTLPRRTKGEKLLWFEE